MFLAQIPWLIGADRRPGRRWCSGHGIAGAGAAQAVVAVGLMVPIYLVLLHRAGVSTSVRGPGGAAAAAVGAPGRRRRLAGRQPVLEPVRRHRPGYRCRSSSCYLASHTGDAPPGARQRCVVTWHRSADGSDGRRRRVDDLDETLPQRAGRSPRRSRRPGRPPRSSPASRREIVTGPHVTFGACATLATKARVASRSYVATACVWWPAGRWPWEPRGCSPGPSRFAVDIRPEDLLARAGPRQPAIGSGRRRASLVINFVTNPPAERSGGMTTPCGWSSLLEQRGHDCRIYSRYQGLQPRPRG